MEISLLDEKSVIVRSNSFINGSYKISTTQSRILLAICLQVRKDDEPGKQYAIPMSLLAQSRDKNKSHTNYKAIHHEAKKLIRPVSLPVENSAKGAFHEVALLTKAHYPADGSGMIYCQFHEDMKPHFLSLRSAYTKYHIEYVWNFECDHSIRIYELLKEFFNKGRNERIFEHGQLKFLLGIEKKYKRKNAKGEKVDNFGEFKRNVLEVVRKELLEHSDIYFEYDTLKKGRAVHKIKFFIFKNGEKKEPILIDPAEGESKLASEILKAPTGFSEALAEQLRKQYDPLLVDFAISKALEGKKAGKVKNPEGFVRTGLANDYFSQEFNKNKILKQKQEEQQLKANQMSSLKAQIEQEYQAFFKEATRRYAEQADEALVEEYLEKHANRPELRDTLNDLRTGELNDEVCIKFGSWLMYAKGLGEPEEHKISVFANKRYQVDFEML